VDNLFAKILLFVAGVVSFFLLPLDIDMKQLAVPFVTLPLSIVYYIWGSISDTRLRVGSLVYLTVGVGLVAGIMKHWSVFFGGGLIERYSWSDFGEMVLDFIVFVLGFLITYLELSERTPRTHTKASDPKSEVDAPPDQEFQPAQPTRRCSKLAVLVGSAAALIAIGVVRDLAAGRTHTRKPRG
jgi:hypothetical protein